MAAAGSALMGLAVIDSIDGEWAVLVGEGRSYRRRVCELAPGVREGDVIDVSTGQVDTEATTQARRKAEAAVRTPRRGGSFDL